MKNVIFLLAAGFLSLASCKKEIVNSNGSTGAINVVPVSAVPADVISAFNSSFSNASETEWQHNSDDTFTCQFNMDNQKHEARFDDNGHQSSYDIICLDAAVPSIVLDAFRSAYATDNVYEWKLNNEDTWKAHFMRNAVKWEVTFNNAGNVIKSEHD
ncbi:hypothetical protein BH10BAC2_BH10BAC2_24110 [soil metagenome]